MKTEVVLKSKSVTVPIVAMGFNENRGCIEIRPSTKTVLGFFSFNENRGCIEILNINNLCILVTCLMKTEVVLKSS